MGGRQKEKEVAVAFRRRWDCGSQLYDSVELASVHRVLDRHLMAPLHARGSAAAVSGNGVLERTHSRRSKALEKTVKGSRRSKALRRTGTSALRSIFRSVTCSKRL